MFNTCIAQIDSTFFMLSYELLKWIASPKMVNL
jgi:hypothetical protein